MDAPIFWFRINSLYKTEASSIRLLICSGIIQDNNQYHFSIFISIAFFKDFIIFLISYSAHAVWLIKVNLLCFTACLDLNACLFREKNLA